MELKEEEDIHTNLKYIIINSDDINMDNGILLKNSKLRFSTENPTGLDKQYGVKLTGMLKTIKSLFDDYENQVTLNGAIFWCLLYIMYYKIFQIQKK